MMVGPSGSGKSTAWRVLLEAMTAIDGIKGESYVIDPKAISKEHLYGTLGKPLARESLSFAIVPKCAHPCFIAQADSTAILLVRQLFVDVCLAH